MASLRWVRRSGCALLVGFAGLSGCGTAPASKAPSAAASATDWMQGSSAPGAPAGSAAASASRAPAHVDDLASAAPADAAVFVNVPGIEAMRRAILPDAASAGVTKAQADEGFDRLLGGATIAAGHELGVDPAVLQALVRAFDGAAAWRTADGTRQGIIARFRDATAVDAILASTAFQRTDDGRWTDPKSGVVIAWHPGPRVLLVAPKRADVELSERCLFGETPSFAGAPLNEPRRAAEVWAAADLARLAPGGVLRPPSRLLASLGSRADKLGVEVKLSLNGDRVPRLGAVLAPTDEKLTRRLPAGAAMALGLSLARRPGKTIVDLIDEIGRVDGTQLSPLLAPALLEATGLHLADLDRALGGEAAIGLYLEPGKLVPLDASAFDHISAFAAVELRDEKAVRAALATFGRALDAASAGLRPRGKPSPRREAGTLTIPIEGDRVAQLAVQSGALTIALGKRAITDKVAARFGKKGAPTLGDAPLFGVAPAPGTVHAFYLADLGSLLGGVRLPIGAIDPALFAGKTGTFHLVLDPSDTGLGLALGGETDRAGIALLGSGAAVAIYAVRRYLVAAKTAEAKNAVGAIARSAAAAFERETLLPGTTKIISGLCASAPEVPSKIPAGMKYAPSAARDHDFDTGDATHGWRCLKFGIEQPIYYQYAYRVGGAYKGPARGCPGPGPKGFEVSAEGDLDGDGLTSLFTLTGVVKPDGSLELAHSLCEIEPFE